MSRFRNNLIWQNIELFTTTFIPIAGSEYHRKNSHWIQSTDDSRFSVRNRILSSLLSLISNPKRISCYDMVSSIWSSWSYFTWCSILLLIRSIFELKFFHETDRLNSLSSWNQFETRLSISTNKWYSINK